MTMLGSLALGSWGPMEDSHQRGWTTGSWHGHTLPPTVAFDVCSREGLRAY